MSAAPLVASAHAPAETQPMGPPAPPQQVEEANPADEEEAPLSRNPRNIAIWSLLGAAGVGVVTGGVFLITAFDEKRRYEDAKARYEDEDNLDAEEADHIHEFDDRRKAREIAAYISFGVAGAAAVAALIVWLATDDEEREPPQTSVSTNGTSLLVSF